MITRLSTRKKTKRTYAKFRARMAKKNNGQWIKSDTVPGKTYWVTETHCQCGDFVYRQRETARGKCKHMHRAAV